MKSIFDDILDKIGYLQNQQEQLNDVYTPLHESKISALGDASDIVTDILKSLWNTADQEPKSNGEYIVHCRRCHDGKETVSSANYCCDEWKISNAFDLIGWMPYSRLFDCGIDEMKK